jgi:hypothetical protein
MAQEEVLGQKCLLLTDYDDLIQRVGIANSSRALLLASFINFIFALSFV